MSSRLKTAGVNVNVNVNVNISSLRFLRHNYKTFLL